jgi:hypothetical protein
MWCKCGADPILGDQPARGFPGCWPSSYHSRRRLRSGSNRRAKGGQGDEAVARRTGNVTQRDDDFLARTEPLADPRGSSLNRGSSGYAEGLRRTRAERRASRRDERRTTMHKAFVVGAGVMGAAVMAAATFTVLVFAGLFTFSSGVGGGNRPVTLAQQPPATTPPSSPATTPPSSPATTPPSSPSDSAATFPPSSTAQTRRSPRPSSNRVAVPPASAGAQVPAQPPSDSSGLEQLSSASLLPPSDAPAPATPITNPAGHAPAGHNK